jgi:NADPH:quinone reductase-like Zn-dependent oxidoreductase
VTELPDPKPGPDDYLIEVHAAATNFFDILQIQGKYQHQPRAKAKPQVLSLMVRFTS